EELFFRGFLGRGLIGRYGVLAGVLLTSLLFGTIHVHPILICGAAAFGICVHLIYLATRSLWVPALLHFLNNAFVVAVLSLFGPAFQEVGRTPEVRAEPTGWGLVAVIALLIALLLVPLVSLLSAWGLYRLRERPTTENGHG